MSTVAGAQGVFKAMIAKANKEPDTTRQAVMREVAVQVFVANIKETRATGSARRYELVVGLTCPECHGTNIELVGNCPLCHTCGWSKC